MRREPHAVGRTLAALLGTLPGACFFGIALARTQPFELETRAVLGVVSVLPAWALAACWAVCASTAARAWLRSTALALVFAALAYGLPTRGEPQPSSHGVSS